MLFTVAVGIKAYLGKDERDLFWIISHECELESHRRTPHSHENHGQRIKVNLRNTCETVKQTTAQKKDFLSPEKTSRINYQHSNKNKSLGSFCWFGLSQFPS